MGRKGALPFFAKFILMALVSSLAGPSTANSQTPCRPLLVGFHGAKDTSEVHMNLLFTHIKQTIHIEIDTMLFGWWDDEDSDGPGEIEAIHHIKKFERRCPSQPIVIIGHSWGGDSAFDVTLHDLKTIPDLIVTLDAVSHMNIRSHHLHPKWINVYVHVPPLVSAALVFPTLSCILHWLNESEAACDCVAMVGGHWKHEDAADCNLKATQAKNHCDLFGLYKTVRHHVEKVLLAESLDFRADKCE